jgi:hypothetical protein
MSSPHRFLSPYCLPGEDAHVREVIGHLGQREQLPDSLATAMNCPPNPVSRFFLTKNSLDTFVLADGVVRPARGMGVNRRAIGSAKLAMSKSFFMECLFV